MSLFNYKAMNATGNLVHGELDAANLVDLELRLKRMGLDLVNGGKAAGLPWRIGSGVPRRELINFCFHLEMLTQAGIPILDALADLRDHTEHGHFREVLASLVESVQGGMHLSQALAEHPVVFSDVFVSLVRAGESSGRLPTVLKRLADNLKWEDELVAYTKKLVIYPVIVSVLILSALSLAMIYLVPQLSHLFKSTGMVLPLHTRALIATSNFFVGWWHVTLALLATATISLKIAVRLHPATRLRYDGMKLRLPVFGPILEKIILCRFASFFALMYTSGITIIDAVCICEGVAGNTVIRAGLEHTGQLIAEGQGLSEAFHRSGLFPPLVLRMLRVGEHVGKLDNALENVTYFYNRDVKESIERLQSIIEPLLTSILGGLLMWVMLSILGPVYDIITHMKT